MKSNSQVARFISERIEASGQLQKDIAHKAGFEQPNIITMIKQGKTRLPLDKVGPLAKALAIDPLILLEMCFEEYHPRTWKAIAPYMASAITEDERKLLAALRKFLGGPFLSALTDESRQHFDQFMSSLRTPSLIH